MKLFLLKSSLTPSYLNRGIELVWEYTISMFKIRTTRLKDFERLSSIFKDNSLIDILKKNKLAALAQPFIPYSLRTIPSIHLAIEDEHILGFIILKSYSKPNNSWQIDEILVDDQIRMEGVGEELLRYVISVYGSYGIEHFLAEIDSENFAALGLFHQCGFRRCAKVYLYEKEIKKNEELNKISDKDFIVKPQTKNDIQEIEKLELSTIPPDLRTILGRPKNYFKEQKDCFVLIDKSRNITIGWFQIQQIKENHFYVEPLISPGWTHLYEMLLNIILCQCIKKEEDFKLTVKVVDYITELSSILGKLGFLPVQAKELLVKTIWQRVKERKEKKAKLGVPFTAPT